jgi:hypothetical protein
MSIKTLSERQRTFRENVVKQGKFRLNLFINHLSKQALERLSVHCALTQQQMLERVIIDYEQRLLQTMKNEEIDVYLQHNLNADESLRFRGKLRLEELKRLLFSTSNCGD